MFVSTLLLVAACGGEPETPGSGESVSPPAEASTLNGTVSGQAAYEQYCIACHETGLLDAPVVGDARDWAEVSMLWQAVVVEHAQEGYLDMPARGGRPELPDEVVQAAVEYMLSVTYPDLPVDMQ